MRLPPISEHEGLRGGDRGGSHSRPLEVCDSVNLNAAGDDWNQEEYVDKKTGQSRVRMTRR